MTKRKLLDGLLLGLKLLLPVLTLIPLVFCSWRLVESRMEDLANMGNKGYHSGTGLYLFASHTLLFGANAVLAIIGGLGLFAAWKHKSCPKHRENMKTFRWLTIAPAISQAAYVLVNLAVMAIK